MVKTGNSHTIMIMVSMVIVACKVAVPCKIYLVNVGLDVITSGCDVGKYNLCPSYYF